MGVAVAGASAGHFREPHVGVPSHAAAQGFDHGGWVTGGFSSPPIWRVLDPFRVLVCRGIEAEGAIYVWRAVNGQADPWTDKPLNPPEREECPCVCVHLLALSVPTWLGACWKRD